MRCVNGVRYDKIVSENVFLINKIPRYFRQRIEDDMYPRASESIHAVIPVTGSGLIVTVMLTVVWPKSLKAVIE